MSGGDERADDVNLDKYLNAPNCSCLEELLHDLKLRTDHFVNDVDHSVTGFNVSDFQL